MTAPHPVDAPYRPAATQQDQRPADGRRFQTQASCDHGWGGERNRQRTG